MAAESATRVLHDPPSQSPPPAVPHKMPRSLIPMFLCALDLFNVQLFPTKCHALSYLCCLFLRLFPTKDTLFHLIPMLFVCQTFNVQLFPTKYTLSHTYVVCLSDVQRPAVPHKRHALSYLCCLFVRLVNIQLFPTRRHAYKC